MATPVPARATIALALLTIMALGWCFYESSTLSTESGPLATPAANRRLTSLALAPDFSTARGIVEGWTCSGRPQPCHALTSTALAALERDTRLIAAYVTLGILLALFARVAGGVTRRVVALIAALIAVGGAMDLAENWLIARMLGGGATLPFAPIGQAIWSDLPPDSTFIRARLAAMCKFTLLLFGYAGAVAAAGGAARRAIGMWGSGYNERAAAEDTRLETIDFDTLIERETDGIFEHPLDDVDGGPAAPRRPRDWPETRLSTAADEPYIHFRQADIIGLALSGGGIRSATFNLGLLQGLHAAGLLRLFDYVSTVSGGGYVGSFWSAWLARRNRHPGTTLWEAELFPSGAEPPAAGRTATAATADPASFPAPGDRARRVDSPQERHLREFSAFLSPRWGFFEIETWTAIVALFSGVVPALLIGLSVIGVTWVTYLALTFPLASGRAPLATGASILVITGIVLTAFEYTWRRFKRETAGLAKAGSGDSGDIAERGRWWYIGFAVFTTVLVAVLQSRLAAVYARVGYEWPIYRRGVSREWWPASGVNGLARWWEVTGIATPPEAWTFSPRLFDYGVSWLAVALVLILVRTAMAMIPRLPRRETLAAFDRVLMRLLALSAVWVALTALWHLVVNLGNLLGAVAAAAAVSGGIFAALRNWIGVALRRPAERGVTDRLKPYLPALLAYFTLALIAVTLAGVLVKLAGPDWMIWWVATAAMTAVLVVALWISPEEFGMHAFYRDRISRAYAGATADGPAAENRGTEPRDGDDWNLDKLPAKPLHLVCCAANDLSGDQVGTLGRGSRSAVLSRYGFALGRHALPWAPYRPGCRLGSAVTASAAAFNSNMGHISVRVGPAVSLLMTMLNLRLGLWVRHPLALDAKLRRWPGLLFYREMLGLTSSSGHGETDVPRSVMRDVHLSDGGHFENLALYELVRRHCRYILLSDCGADPEVAFDDLGNAFRRIREDFGVDIELDVSPLRPDATRLSRQHVAVGTIHYSATDVGILLYLKPSITGDEPPDVQQYRTRNTAFPHEATTDQFYDEAQWESYRRLGLHAVEQIFHFVTRRGGRHSADWVFAEASHRWGTTPEWLEARVLEMTKRFGELEAEFSERHGQHLLRDGFPELECIPAEVKEAYTPPASDGGAQSDNEPAAGGPSSALPDPEALMAAELTLLLRVAQLMEDVWLACGLDRWWRHSMNLGWINLFARWATGPKFQFWWPLLRPMFSPGFQQFIEQRFPQRDSRDPAAIHAPQAGVIRSIEQPEDSGLAALWWQRRAAQPMPWTKAVATPFTRVYYENVMVLPRDGGDVPVQVGLVAVTLRRDSRQVASGTSGSDEHRFEGAPLVPAPAAPIRAGWSSDDFFVPPSLWGAGLGGSFLNQLIDTLAGQLGDGLCQVIVKAPPAAQAHQVARDDRQAFVDQYRKFGFREARPADRKGYVPDMEFAQALGYLDGDVILLFDLARRVPQKATP